MKRLIPFAVLALAAMASIPTTAAAPKSHWRDLNKDLAPVNVQLQSDIGLFALAFADAGQEMQTIFFSSPLAFSSLDKSTQKLKEAEARIKNDLKAIKADAQAGVDVLDSYAPEECSVHFTSYEYTMFSTWLETADSWLAGQDTGAISAAIYLDGLSPVDLTPLPAGGPLDLLWSRVTCAGAAPSPAPPSAAAS